MKIYIIAILINIVSIYKGFTQDLNQTEAVLSNFAKRIYNIEKFEGVKLIEEDNNKYALIAVKLDKKNIPSSSLATLANVKAKAYLSKFQNGSYLTTEFILLNSTNDSISKQPISNEIIKEYSSGFTKGMASLTTIDEIESNQIVYIFYSKLSN